MGLPNAVLRVQTCGNDWDRSWRALAKRQRAGMQIRVPAVCKRLLTRCGSVTWDVYLPSSESRRTLLRGAVAVGPRRIPT